MHRAAAWLLLLGVGCRCRAADGPDLLDRIRQHMRDYLARLPDYTCRVTIERAERRSSRSPFIVRDRLRLEIAYASGREYYAWPGDTRFESTIDELLPRSGMIAEGNFALHMRKLFLTADAEFSPAREDGQSLRVDFSVPAARSGFSIGAGGTAAPAALRGSVWFDPATLDVQRLEVRVENTPRSVRIAGTREMTTYSRIPVGDVLAVLPADSEILLRDRDGSEHRNHSRFEDCRRYSGSSTVHYDAPAPPTRELRLDRAIPENVAIGDTFSAGSAQLRVTGLRREGNRWSIEFTLTGTAYTARVILALPAPAGVQLTFQ